jgi:acid phosphatase
MSLRLVAAAAAAGLSLPSVALALGAGTLLDPVQAVLLPDAASAKDPLSHLGANGPWTAGQ